MEDNLDLIITYLRETTINTIVSNWKESINSLNYKIGTINSDEYQRYLTIINRIYTTEIASIAQGIKSVECELPESQQPEPYTERRDHAKIISEASNDMHSLLQNTVSSIANNGDSQGSEPVDNVYDRLFDIIDKMSNC